MAPFDCGDVPSRSYIWTVMYVPLEKVLTVAVGFGRGMTGACPPKSDVTVELDSTICAVPFIGEGRRRLPGIRAC